MWSSDCGLDFAGPRRGGIGGRGGGIISRLSAAPLSLPFLRFLRSRPSPSTSLSGSLRLGT